MVAKQQCDAVSKYTCLVLGWWEERVKDALLRIPSKQLNALSLGPQPLFWSDVMVFQPQSAREARLFRTAHLNASVYVLKQKKLRTLTSPGRRKSD